MIEIHKLYQNRLKSYILNTNYLIGCYAITSECTLRYAVILAFDVKIDKDAQELSDQLGIKIFTADIIYHLFDNYTAHVKVIF